MTNTFLKAMTFQYHGERARQTTRELCRFLTAVANRKMPRWYYVAWTAGAVTGLVRPGKTPRVLQAGTQAK